jgi:hypothetical protein
LNRRFVLLGLPLALAACSTRGGVTFATEAEVAAARYAPPPPPSLALITVREESREAGVQGKAVHSALLISASERVLYDPVGAWSDPRAPERHDVLHGFSPEVEERYLAYQADDGYYYVRQEVAVPLGVAETALARAAAKGPTRQPWCTRACSQVLTGLPGLEPVRTNLFPDGLAAQMARVPGVVTTERHGPGYSAA